MTDLNQHDLWRALNPYLPHLFAGRSEGVPPAVRRLWRILLQHLRTRRAAAVTLYDLYAEQDNPDAQAAFRQTLKKLLQEATFAAAVAPLAADLRRLGEAASHPERRPRSGLAALADRAVIIGGNAEGVIVVTGDGNQVVYAPEDIEPQTLLQAYYRAVAEECRQLPLGILDPNFASPLQQDQVALDEVYTDLHVSVGLRLSDEAEDVPAMGLRLARGEEGRRRPLLEVIGGEEAVRLALIGDPGSGKTTFVNYLTYLLATDYLNGTRNERLPAALRGLLPLRLVLRRAARALPTDGSPGRAGMLWQAIQEEIADRLGGPAAERLLPYLQRQMGRRGALFLLDGLDEVPDADRRRKCLLEAVHAFSGQLHRRHRVLLTARPYAYADPRWRLPGFELTALAPFDAEQVTRFVKRWYRAVAPVMGWQETTAVQRGERLAREVQARPYLADLASRPLLLTLMATLDSSWGKLPEDRADLYEESVKLLLSRWQRGRETRNAAGQPDWEPGITQALGVGEETIRAALEKLAYQTHQRQGAERERSPDSADIPREKVLDVFSAALPEGLNPRVLLQYLETRAGLLIGRRENVYAFPHRSFQEYLAACHLAAVEQDFAGKMRSLLRQDLDWWREVFLLGVGKKRMGGLGGAVGLLHILLPQEPERLAEKTDWDWRLAALIGEALLEMRLDDRAAGADLSQGLRERVQRWLVQLVEEGRLAPAERLRAGDLLGRLGDPRFASLELGGQMVVLPRRFRGQEEPDLGFVHIPGGTFLMGSDPQADPKAYEDEQPQHEVFLPAYWIARYPVTNRQYAAFMQAGGYEKRRYWTAEGWAWRQGAAPDFSAVETFPDRDFVRRYKEWVLSRSDRSRPHFWQDPRWGADTRPVVGVTWYEALAYCAWLEERLRQGADRLEAEGLVSAAFLQALAQGRYRVRLPSEAEWEKAARGSSGRLYPWEGTLTPERANYAAADLGQTSPVGMFPRGATPATRLLDLGGNVWEWTRSQWGADLAKPGYTYPYDPADGREALSGPAARVVRGGSWRDPSRGVRAAVRFRIIPINFYDDLGFRVVFSLAERR